MSKALIVQTSLTDFYSTPHRISGLGMLSLQGILKDEYSEVEILNFPVMGKKKTPVPSQLSYLNRYRIQGETGPLAWFSRYYRFGPSIEDQAGMILDKKPDSVWFSLFAWAYAEDMLAVAKRVKQARPALPLTLGGSGATVMASYFRSTGLFEEVVEGEAENRFGREWKEPAVSVRQGRAELIISLMLSRGCPRSCEFCSNHLTFGHKFRTLPPEAILDRLKPLATEQPVHFNFEDDNLLFRKEAFFSLLKELKHLFPSAGFYAENGLDYSLLNEDDIIFLIGHGFEQFNFSLATASESTAEKQKRFLKPDLLRALTKLIEQQGKNSICYFICGLREDTPDSIRETFSLFRTLPSRMGISLFYPVPGIQGFTDRALFERVSPVLCKGSSAWPWTGSLTTEEMTGFFRLARLHNFMKTAPDNAASEELKARIQQTGEWHTLIRNQGRAEPFKHRFSGPEWLNRELLNYV